MKVHIEALIAGPLFRSPPGGGGGIAGGADMVGMTKIGVQMQAEIYSNNAHSWKRIKCALQKNIRESEDRCSNSPGMFSVWIQSEVEVEVEVGK